MSRNPVPAFVIAAAFSACAAESELLNSERIEERFGNYGLEVLKQDGDIRRSNLYSTDAGVRTCRTYAVVQFIESPVAAIQPLHGAVLSGQSLGSTFRDAGWAITKESLFVGGIELTDRGYNIARLMRITGSEQLAMHAYRLMLERDSESIHYATIIEVHHPEYLGVPELEDLYPVSGAGQSDRATVNGFVALVQSD